MKPDEIEKVRQFETRNQARLDFLAAWPDIESLIEKDFTVVAIYKYLRATARISMTYGTFANHLRSKKNPGYSPKVRIAKPKQIEVAQQTPEPPPVAVEAASLLPEHPEEGAQPLGTQKNAVTHENNAEKNKTKLI